MPKSFYFPFAFVVLLIGTFLSTEIIYRKKIQDLPRAPVETSAVQQNVPAPILDDFRKSTETAALSESAETDFPVETFEMADNTDGESPTAAFNQKVETPPPPVPDWRNDDEVTPAPKGDPWHPEEMSLKFKDWDALTHDEQLSIAHKHLLKEFGDIPEVRTIIAFDQKPKHLPTTIDMAIAHTAACLALWPDERTRQCLSDLKELKANGFKEFPGAK